MIGNDCALQLQTRPPFKSPTQYRISLPCQTPLPPTLVPYSPLVPAPSWGTVGRQAILNEQNQKMSLKESMRAGDSGGRKAAVREQLLPSQHPLTKPTRDISASNRSHSITREDPPVFHSDRRLLLLEREAEEIEFQKQANIVYTKQFRSLAKLMGNESMEFDQLREKIESLVLKDFPAHPDPALFQRIQNLERELAKRNLAVQVNRSSQSLPSSNEYLRGLENELGRKSKMINELSDSIKRQAFQEAIKNMQAEIEAKTQELKQVEDQSQQLRMKANNSISILEEELIRHKQTIQKLTFELDTQKRKAQNSVEDIERLKRKEKQLAASLQSETKANYQGLSYSTHALLMQLEARDQELTTTLNQQRFLQQELYTLRQEQGANEDMIKRMTQELQSLNNRLEMESSQKERLLEEIQQVTRQLQSSHLAISSANSNHVLLLTQKERQQQNLLQASNKIHDLQQSQAELRQDRNSCIEKISQLEQVTNNLKIHINQARSEVTSKDEQLSKFHKIVKELEKELTEKLRIVQSQDNDFEAKNRELYELKEHLAQKEEDFAHELDVKSRQFAVELQAMRIQMVNYENLSQEYSSTITRLEEQNLHFKNQIISLDNIKSQKARSLSEKEDSIAVLQQRIEAFQQEKYVLMQRIQDIEKEYSDLDQRYRRLEDIQRGRSGLEIELASKEKQEHQLRILLEEAATKEAHLEADLYQKDQHIKEIIEDRERNEAKSKVQVAELSKFIEELQNQLQNQRNQQQQRQEDENRVRDELQDEIRLVRSAITEIQAKHRQEMNFQLDLQRNNENTLLKLKQDYNNEYQQKEKLYHQIEQLKDFNQKLRVAVEERNDHLKMYEDRIKDDEQRYLRDRQTMENEIAELKFVIDEIKNEKTEIEKELQMTKKTRENQLGSFSFNHFEGSQQESPNKLRGIIDDLQQKLEVYKREEQERIRLSYSHTIEASPTAMFGSLQSENEYLLNERKKIEEEIQAYKHHLTEQQEQIVELNNHLHHLNSQLQESKHLLEEKQAFIREITQQASNQRILDAQSWRQTETSLSQQLHHREELIQLKQNQFAQLTLRYKQEVQNVETLRQEIQSIRFELNSARQANEARTVTMELQRTKEQLEKAVSQIVKLRSEIALAFRQLQVSRREAQRQKVLSMEYQKKAEVFQNKVSELQERVRKASRQMQSQQPHRNLSRLSKRSNISQHEREDNRSKAASSDGQLSRRILNDPSKISGQESKFAHNLLVFENSKIHVTREVVQDIKSQEKEIKEQKQEESVLSKQQAENRTPESSHRQINTTHFQRISNDNSRKESLHNIINQNESIRSQEKKQPNDTPQQRSKINSLTSIRQAEEVQEASAQPVQNSSNSSNISKERQPQARPKEYLPQQSSKKTISNANESKQNVSIEQQPPRTSFHRQSQFSNVPIYVARQSQLQPLPQNRAQGSESRSGSKTKVRISYGQPSDKSMEIKRRQPERMAGSQVSRVSMHSNKLVIENSINQVSPIHQRSSNAQPQTPQSFFSREHLQFQPRQSNQFEPIDQPSESIINGINQLGSRLSTFGNPRASITDPPKNQVLRRQSNPILIQPRIDSAHSPRHSNNVIRSTQTQQSPYRTSQFIRTAPINRKESKKEELTVPPSKIVMRSVIGGKRNSLLNDTATFGKNSQKGAPWQNDGLSDSVDSGIDVLQLDWMAPCCKNE